MLLQQRVFRLAVCRKKCAENGPTRAPNRQWIPGKLAEARRPAMVLLAALIGFPDLGPGLLTLLHHSAIKTPRLRWTEFLEQLKPARSPVGWFNAADPRLTPIEAEGLVDVHCLLRSMRKNRLAALASRRHWTRMSRTLPSWSTARHGY